jgi:hypothetical protein
MLSQRETQALVGIEEHLRANDPDLARAFELASGSVPPRRSRVSPNAGLAGLAGLALGMLLFAVGYVTRNADTALVGAAALLADAAWWATLAVITLARSRGATRVVGGTRGTTTRLRENSRDGGSCGSGPSP